jgi:hypothetical protein
MTDNYKFLDDSFKKKKTNNGKFLITSNGNYNEQCNSSQPTSFLNCFVVCYNILETSLN